MTEFWTYGLSHPTLGGEAAERAEKEGWDGVVFVDSQNLAMDPYVAMSIAAAATSTLKVSPGVTNAFTRHAAVTATSIASIHAQSGGRASLGIGRGDSALAHLGFSPVSIGRFEQYVEDVQAYLSGGEVPFRGGEGSPASAASLNLASAPASSSLKWLRPRFGKVPVEVVASGPKVIAIGARHADIVTFTVGAGLDRVRWAIDTARAARQDVGRGGEVLQLGAYVNLVCEPDRRLARTLVAGGLSAFSRFSAMHGSPTGPVSSDADSVLRNIHGSYEMTHHAGATSSQNDELTDEFVDQFAIVGDEAYCIQRLHELIGLGIDRIVITQPHPPTQKLYPDETAQAHHRLVANVLPRMRE